MDVGILEERAASSKVQVPVSAEILSDLRHDHLVSLLQNRVGERHGVDLLLEDLRGSIDQPAAAMSREYKIDKLNIIHAPDSHAGEGMPVA